MSSTFVLLLLLSIGLLASQAPADVHLPQLVSDHMVLQRDSKIIIWGWADPGETLQVQFHGCQVSARANRQGRWSTSLGPFPAGGPFDMTINGKNTLEFSNCTMC